MATITNARNDVGENPKNIGFRASRDWWKRVEEWGRQRGLLTTQELGIFCFSKCSGIKHPVKGRGGR